MFSIRRQIRVSRSLARDNWRAEKKMRELNADAGMWPARAREQTGAESDVALCDRIGYPSPPEPVFGNSRRVPITRDRRPKLLSQTGRTKKPFLLLLRVRRKAAKPVSCQAGAAKPSARCRPFQPAARVMALGFFQPSRARYPACLPGRQDRMRGESVRDGKRGSSRLGRIHPLFAAEGLF